MTLKEKIEKFVEEKKIGQHVRDHKDLYIGLGTGVSILALTLSGRHATINAPTKSPVRFFNLLAKDSGNIIVNVIVRDGAGHPGYPTYCVETLEEFLTQGAAALAAGVSSKIMSYHLQGRLPDIKGLHYQRMAI